jgi:DNA-directed RNA polymerase specialized sigma24 family protein
MNDKGDEELAERAKTGDPAAFGELVDRYAKRLVRFLVLTKQLPLHEAEDVAQDTWLKAWKNLAKREPGEVLTI